MSHTAKEVTTIPLSGTKNGIIEVAIIEEPYGEGSASVASVGVFLDKENSEPDWKVHIPKDNIDAVVEALQKAKESL